MKKSRERKTASRAALAVMHNARTLAAAEHHRDVARAELGNLRGIIVDGRAGGASMDAEEVELHRLVFILDELEILLDEARVAAGMPSDPVCTVIDRHLVDIGLERLP